MLGGDELMMHSRKPEIMADAAYIILCKPSREFTGHFCIDDTVIEGEGITDLSRYAVNPELPLAADFFVEPKDV
jgi:citronellol/citronellal dehydrogenase